MKVTGTNSYIVLEDKGRKIKVQGERVSGGFIADISSIEKFEPPYQDEKLTEDIKQRYINKAVRKTAGTHMVITFE